MSASQTRAVCSSEVVARRLPSGLQAAALTDPPRPVRANSSLPVVASQTRAVPSWEPERMRVPSGLQASPHKASKWPA